MSQLKRTLDGHDLILQNIAAIVGFSTLALSAQFGWSSITLNLVVLILFVFPAIVMILDLSLRIPDEGGFYVWTKTAFGPWHGFVAAWSYWLSNLVWFPSVMLSVLTVGGFLFYGPEYQAENQLWIGLLFLWIVIGINILGLQKAKWIQNIGGLATGLTILLLTIMGIFFWLKVGSVRNFEFSDLIPKGESLELLPFFAAITFSWAGIELTPVIAGEVKDPQKTIPKALIISAVLIVFIFSIGILGLLVSIPQGEMDEILGIPQAFQSMTDALGISWLNFPATFLVLLSFVGLFAAWMTGNARVPFVIGLDRFLPPALGKVHPKFQSPYISLITQGVLISVLFTGATAGSTLKEAFLVLVDMSIILFFIPFLYMFIAFRKHNRLQTGDESLQWLKGKRTGIQLVGFAGLAVTIFTIVMALLPSPSIQNLSTYYLKVVGGSMLLMSVGFTFYFRNLRAK